MKKKVKIPWESIKNLMKLSVYAVISFGVLTSLFAHESKGQTIDSTFINIEFDNVSIEKALLKIEKESGFRMIFNPKKLNSYGNVKQHFSNSSVSNILESVLAPTPLTFEQVGPHIVLKEATAIQLDGSSKNGMTGTESGLDEILDNPVKDQNLVSRDNVQEKLGEIQRLVIGKVLSSFDGQGLPGATVLLKGTTTGTTSDFEGNYTISIVENLENPILIFSYIGMVTQEVAIGNQSEIIVTLVEDISVLNEVVVTSFGRQQQKKSLGFSVQEVEGETISDSQQPNIANALQGQVAGVQVTSSGGTPGASSSILIRGGTSIDGNIQPLFVLDGIPVDNETVGEPIGGSGQLARSVSNSNRALDINPADIESVSVLKGPAAAALYGIRASNGAIIITTKSGKSGVTRLNYSSSYEIMEVNRLPSSQTQYKQGTGGVEGPSNFSWGPRYGPSDQVFDNFNQFFGTGSLTTHNVNASGGSEKATFYLSASRTDQDGVVPNTDYNRTTVKVKGDVQVLKGLKMGGSVSYTNSNSLKPLEGPGVLGGSGGVTLGLINWPRNDDVSNFRNDDGSPRNFGTVDNPFWSAFNNTNKDKLNRFIGLYNISADPFEWLNINYKLGTDFYNQNFEGLRTPGTTLAGNENGGLFLSEAFNQITTSNLIVTVKKELFKDFRTTLFVGNNVEWSNTRTTSLFGTDFNNPDFVGIRNSNSIVPDQFTTRKRIVSAFGNLEFDYKGLAFVNLTARNDWTSTLPLENRSFFYPSIGGSFVFSELLNPEKDSFLTFGKIRATWAEVGKDAPPHRLASSLENNIGVGGGFKTGFFGNNQFIKPETTQSFEIGTDIRFFNNRLGLDFTYYDITSEDQIIQPRVSQGTGFIFLLINGGTIENKGYEVSLNAAPIRTENLGWDININWSTNQSKLIELPAELPVFVQSDALTVLGLAQGASFVDETFFGLEGSVWERNDDGDLVIGADGFPIVQGNQNLMADREPDWIAGITNTIRYKNLNLSFLFDFRQGGDVFNGTEFELVRSGLSTKTLDRGTSTVFDGVIRNVDGTFSPNTQQVILDQGYYQNIFANNARNFIEDGSWARLRYVALNYNLPSSLIDRLPIKSASLNVTGKNLLLFTDYTGVDPEVDSGGAGVRGTGSTGIDYGGVPSTRGVSLGINVSF